MSTPLNSPHPEVPSGSSNPFDLVPWFQKIVDWIKGLSPSGASKFDTDYIQDNAGFTPGTGWASPIFVYRRWGKLVYIYVQVTASQVHTVNSATGALTNSQFGIINDPSLRPNGPDIGYGLSGGNSRMASTFVTRNGAVGGTISGTAQLDIGSTARAYGYFLLV